jgi:hypothetical protein
MGFRTAAQCVASSLPASAFTAAHNLAAAAARAAGPFAGSSTRTCFTPLYRPLLQQHPDTPEPEQQITGW